jgi:hypothetical protein
MNNSILKIDTNPPLVKHYFMKLTKFFEYLLKTHILFKCMWLKVELYLGVYQQLSHFQAVFDYERLSMFWYIIRRE